MFEEYFLRLNAGKHFVALAYELRREGHKPVRDHASCFVIDVGKGVWCLVTAGHVIQALRDLVADGWSIERPRLIDAFAGVQTEAIPFLLDLSEWLVLVDEETGADLAAVPLTVLFQANLKAGGVQALERGHINTATFEAYSQVVVAGVPAEGFIVKPGSGQMRFVVIPVLATSSKEARLPDKPGTLLGKLPPNPADPQHRVESIAGMSGCPVFAIDCEPNGQPKCYWAIGVQSSWHPDTRSIRFTPLDCLAEALHEVIAAETRDLPPGEEVIVRTAGGDRQDEPTPRDGPVQ
jgi:hypothetical protein